MKLPLSNLTTFLLFTACLSSFEPLAFGINKNEKHDKSKMNFLIIVVDDLGFMDIEPNNPNTFYKTPNITQLAKEGVNFTNSYAANPVCSPSRVALMTGINPARLKTTDWFHHKNGKRLSGRYNAANSIDYLPSEIITLPEALPKEYNSVFIGKWHLGEPEKYWPKQQGFDSNIGGWSSGSPRGGYFAPYTNPRLTQGPKGEYLTQRLTNEAISRLANVQDDPFLMVLSYYSVHVPLQAPKETIQHYRKLSPTHQSMDNFAVEEQVLPQKKNLRRVRIKQNHPTYAAMVEHMDANVGRVLAELNRTGLDKNTVVIFTSDNGGLSTSEGHPTSNLPYRGGKGWVYEGGIKVPLIIKVPNHEKSNTVQSTPVIGMDIPATILAMAKQNVASLDGVNLIPLINDTSASLRRPLFWHYPHYSNQGGVPAAAVRLGEFKLIQRLESGEVQLFNLEKDSGEQNNVAANYPKKVKHLLHLLTQWYKEVDAQFLQPKSNNTPWKITQDINHVL